MTELIDTEFIEEGTIRRRLRLVTGKLVEVERETPQFADDFNGLVRGTVTRNLYNKWELTK